MPTYAQMWPKNANWWDQMHIRPNKQHQFDEIAEYAMKHRKIYKEIEAETGVPWAMTAVIHQREASGRFDRYLGNGQPLNKKTTIVPKGRGPFKDFVAGAIDAYKIDGLSKVEDWRLEKQLYYMEKFNGWGYANRKPPMPSPYIWGGTNVQVRGKYVADGVFDANVMDQQLGCAGMLKMIAELDSTIEFVRETPPESV